MRERDAREKLRPGDVILAVDGKSGWTRCKYLAYLMRDKEPGATVRLRVRRGAEVVDVEFALRRNGRSCWGTERGCPGSEHRAGP